MDASLVNGLSAAAAGMLPKQSAPKAATSGAADVPTVQVPVADTVEISAAAQNKVSAPAVFDPTAMDGPYEQKHIGGVLATSSAIDGYNGWEAMLKHCFGIKNGGDRNDRPVIPSYSWINVGPYSADNGYMPSDQLSMQERNLIANMFVYAHDHGLNEETINMISTPSILSSGIFYQHIDVEFSWVVPKDPAQRVEGLTGRAAIVEYLRQGTIKPPPMYFQPDEVTQNIVQTLSSAAIDDNLIPRDWIVNFYGEDTWGALGSNSVQDYKDAQALIYAYSRNHSDGAPSTQGIKSATTQRYLSWRNTFVAEWNSMIEESKQPSTLTPGTDSVSKVIGAEGVKPNDIFSQFSKRIKGLVESLNDSQKFTLGMMYKLASDRGNKNELEKVDALAKAMVTSNYMDIMFLPGLDKDGKKTTNLLDMLVWTKDIPDQTQFLQAYLNKKHEPALAKVQEKLASPAESVASKPAPAHLDIEA